jgi:aspartate/glutamate racemase
LSKAKNAGVACIVPLTSQSLAKFDLSGSLAQEYDLQCRRLEGIDQVLISRIIEEVKIEGAVSDANLAELSCVVEKLKSEGVGACVLGCTELSTLKVALVESGLPTFDSNEALADAAIRALNLPLEILR